MFAARAFKKGETLTYYGGEDLGRAGTDEGEEAMRAGREGEAGRYILELNGRYVKADLKSDNPAHMINDAGYKHAKAVCGGGGLVKVKDNATIGAGEEIFWCYGKKYWQFWGPRLELPAGIETGGGRGAGAGRGRGAGAGRGRGAGRAEVSRGRGRGRQEEAGQQMSRELGATRVLRRRVGGRAVGEDGVT